MMTPKAFWSTASIAVFNCAKLGANFGIRDQPGYFTKLPMSVPEGPEGNRQGAPPLQTGKQEIGVP